VPVGLCSAVCLPLRSSFCPLSLGVYWRYPFVTCCSTSCTCSSLHVPISAPRLHSPDIRIRTNILHYLSSHGCILKYH
jgi:hypothetical protein